MTEPKIDELSSTGRHHAWTTESLGSIVRAGSPRETQRSWLDRKQTVNSRHAAITRSLSSWSSYKSWTDKVRHDWDKDKNKKDK
jgi:hypothetical protein